MEKLARPYPIAMAGFPDGTIISRSIGQPAGKPIDRTRLVMALRRAYTVEKLGSAETYRVERQRQRRQAYSQPDGSAIEAPYTPIYFVRRETEILRKFIEGADMPLGPEPIELLIEGEHEAKPEKAITEAQVKKAMATILAFSKQREATDVDALERKIRTVALGLAAA